MRLDATKSVYCYYFPEVRRAIDKVVENYPHDVFLKSIEPGLDDFHKPVIDKFVKHFGSQASDLNDYKYKYVTDGSRQGIFHLLVELHHKEPDTIFYVLEGEYEGYKEYAIRMGIEVVEVPYGSEVEFLEPGIFFLSNPSGRDGNIISNRYINYICETHRVVYDLAYLGLTQSHYFNLHNPNIIAVVASMSKSFGMYYYRLGFAFTKDPLETLIANKWFKNIFSIVVADKVLDTINPGQLYNKYKPIQEKIIHYLNATEDIDIKESDVFLLGYKGKSIENPTTSLKEYERGKFYRLCLTPYFLSGAAVVENLLNGEHTNGN